MMSYVTLIMLFYTSLVFSLLVFTLAEDYDNSPMPKKEREQLKEEARDMFYHAYRAYMENAYPADELMPLSCKGRYRGITPNRGDMDDILGNFSLTLVDSLDTLVILGDFEEFEHAVKLVIKDVSFDSDIVVSVFETNIRMLGGLLSAHILALGLQESGDYLTWYRGELLALASDIGKRLLPAFNTSTGIPHARINLRHGMLGLENSRETCTACAGTMILEMAALSRLTGEPIFEHKAHKAMDRLWKIRHRSSDLMGTVMNIHSGDWIRKESGVGAGIDSYYEYCLKAYILLGDETYLARFYRHYNAVMKYVSRGPMMFDVHMHRPHTQSRHFMDALLAFWPGLQVLLGDVRPAVETHEMLYQVMQRHTFIPEAFTADFQVHWGQHPLRPEFLESTYFLHRATNDDHYLRVGKAALKSLQKHTRVPCGYAAVNDVRTRIHEDRMDSFVLAETFKYLYMMFADDAELPVNLDEFILTTEAHLLPLSLAGYNRNVTSDKSRLDDDRNLYQYSRTCPNTLKLLPASVRKPLKNMMGECRNHVSFRRLLAKQFRPDDPEHIHTLSDMGISVLTLLDGRVQLLHTFSMAKSARDAEEGLIFMREMAEVAERSAAESEGAMRPRAVAILSKTGRKLLAAGPAHFGPDLQGNVRVESTCVLANPLKACSFIQDIASIKGNIVIAERGHCTFAHKVRRLQTLGAVAVIIVDNIPGSSRGASPLFFMSGDGANDVTIPAVFLFSDNAVILKNSILNDPNVKLILGDLGTLESEKPDLPLEKDQIFDKSDVRFRLDEVYDKTLNDGKNVLVSYEPKILYQTVTAKNIEDVTDSNADVHQSKQGRYHWLNSIISEIDSQFYDPVHAVKEATKFSEFEGSKKTLKKAVTKLLEDMKGMIYNLGGVTVNKVNNNLEGAIHPTADEDINIREIYKVLQANRDDNIIVRNSGELDYNVLLGKLTDQIEKVNQRISTLKKMDALMAKDSIKSQEDSSLKINFSDELVKSDAETIDLDEIEDDDDEFQRLLRETIPSR